jgi:hypothetical protein
MLSTSLAAFRKDPAKYFDKVIDNSETLLINRGKDSAFVVLSIDEYLSMIESCHGDSSIFKEFIERQLLAKKFKRESELVSEESLTILHEFDALETPD